MQMFVDDVGIGLVRLSGDVGERLITRMIGSGAELSQGATNQAARQWAHPLTSTRLYTAGFQCGGPGCRGPLWKDRFSPK